MPEIIEEDKSWQRQEVLYLIHTVRMKVRLARLRIGKHLITDAEKILLVGIQKNISMMLASRNA